MRARYIAAALNTKPTFRICLDICYIKPPDAQMPRCVMSKELEKKHVTPNLVQKSVNLC